MKIIYLSSACYEKNKYQVDKTAKIKLENNIIKFHNAIIEGLAMQKNVEVKSIIGLPISIKTNKKIIWKRKIDKKKNIEYYQLGFINLPILKQSLIAIKTFKLVKNYIKKANNEEVAIIYDASFVSIMPMVNHLIKKYEIKSIGIFADIYDYMLDVERKSNKNNLIKKIYRRKMQKVYNDTSAYVFLTEYMNEIVNKNKKPYIIMEGITTLKTDDMICKEEITKKNYVMYAGGLYEEYGIKNLIEAFSLIENNKFELHIYGQGDLENYIKNIKNANIKYYGVINNELIKQKEKKATLLVNPRFTDKEYTKYSFPSKTIEYMKSATPVLTTKLKGIPKEYFRYIYTFEEETPKGMATEIKKILNKKPEELIEKGIKAKEFVCKEKNNLNQAKRILNLILDS